MATGARRAVYVTFTAGSTAATAGSASTAVGFRLRTSERRLLSRQELGRASTAALSPAAATPLRGPRGAATLATASSIAEALPSLTTFRLVGQVARSSFGLTGGG